MEFGRKYDIVAFIESIGILISHIILMILGYLPILFPIENWGLFIGLGILDISPLLLLFLEGSGDMTKCIVLTAFLITFNVIFFNLAFAFVLLIGFCIIFRRFRRY